MELKKLWPYDHQDKTTWKFIDFLPGENKRTGYVFIRKWYLNADFRFKHLDKNWERDSRAYEMKHIKDLKEAA